MESRHWPWPLPQDSGPPAPALAIRCGAPRALGAGSARIDIRDGRGARNSPDGGAWPSSVTTQLAGDCCTFAPSTPSGAAESLAGTDGASMPFWSPDSRRLGFFAQGKLKTVDVVTSRVQTLANAAGARGGTWNRDDVIVRAASWPWAVSHSCSGGEAAPVLIEGADALKIGIRPFCPMAGTSCSSTPQNNQPENAAVFVGSLDPSPARKRVVRAQSGAIDVRPGYLLFWRDGTLMAQAFDERSRDPRKMPLPWPARWH